MRTVWLSFALLSLVGSGFNTVGCLASTSAYESDMEGTRSLALTGMALGALALSRSESSKDGGEGRG